MSFSDAETCEWRDVVGYEGSYQVSSHGEVRSVDRRSTTIYGIKRSLTGKVLSPTVSKKGYSIVSLFVTKKINAYVHRLVARAFLGEFNGLEVNHKNGIKTDNRLGNIELVSHQENVKHSRDTGLCNDLGENSSKSKLKNSDVLQIKNLLTTSNFSTSRIAKMFFVTPAAIRKIRSKTTWKHLDTPTSC